MLKTLHGRRVGRKLGKKKLVEYTFSQIPKNILSDSYVVTNDKKI